MYYVVHFARLYYDTKYHTLLRRHMKYYVIFASIGSGTSCWL